MSKILIMDEGLANKIAAGEVVERLVNVVKELVENSIDAKASEIKIELVDSGIKKIIVNDNGIGMDKEDAVLCFSRHATSKLKNEKDLFRISSLGFRGEAMPSIASVSKLNLKTSTGKSGTEVEIHGGEIIDVKAITHSKGTTIEVSDLFYNTPVRLKYIKNLYTELSHIIDYVNKMALSYPNIRFKLVNNDKVLLNTDGSGNILKVISKIYGIDVAKKMIYVEEENEDYKIYGYISMPEVAKSKKSVITTFVNNRLVKNNEINKVIIDAYHNYIHATRTPIVVLNIEVDNSLVDVNIHPTKMDIKFSKIDSLKSLLSNIIKEQLENRNLSKTTIQKSVNTLNVIEKYIEKEEEPVPKKVEEVQFDFYVEDEESKYKTENEIKEIDSRIKPMRVLGNAHSTYILCENEDGFYLVDQHAAAERINFERILDEFDNLKDDKIDLLIPLKIELSNSDYVVFKEKINHLEELGFSTEEFGDNTIIIRTIPYWLDENRLDESVRSIIDLIIEEKEFKSSKFNEKVAAMAACKSSIRANEHLSMEGMQNIVDLLIKCRNPFNCAHGRPTIISLSNYKLERLFLRNIDC